MEDLLIRLIKFFGTTDEYGATNIAKVSKYQKVLRRVESTKKDTSVEVIENNGADVMQDTDPSGIVMQEAKIIGFGINIFNEDIYPLKSFEIYLRGCNLIGTLDVTDAPDMKFLDIYHNKITAVKTGNMPSMRIFGVQDNLLEELDVTGMPAVQGIDAGKNNLKKLDVSKNSELVELYVNDNKFTSIDISHNPKLKYFYCHNNKIKKLDATANPLLRHLDATGNQMTSIRALAPKNDKKLPLELTAGDGGYVGLKFNPVYDAQWKETGKWEQCYYAYPKRGYRFAGWYENGVKVSDEETLADTFGNSRVLTAEFEKK